MYTCCLWPLVNRLDVAAALLLLNRSVDKLELHGTILERRAIPHTLCYTCASRQLEVEVEALPCCRCRETELKLSVGLTGHPYSS